MRKTILLFCMLLGMLLLLGCSLENEPIILLDGGSESTVSGDTRQAPVSDLMEESGSAVSDSDVYASGSEVSSQDHESILSDAASSEEPVSEVSEVSEISEAGEESEIIDRESVSAEQTDDPTPVCSHLQTKIVDQSDATCTADGYSGDRCCRDCGVVIERGKRIPANGHQSKVINQKDATTTVEGYSGDTVCRVCGELLAGGSVIPKLESTDKTGSDQSLVWIPVNGGTKYHKKSTCSKMKNPQQVTLETAEARGFEPCKKCYR